MWQQAMVAAVFGFEFKQTGYRVIREVFQYVPRKNGKTTLCGALVNLVAFCDDEAGAQIYSAAAEREQAALVYRQTKGMLNNNDELSNKTKTYVTFKSIEYPNNVFYKALSADADSKHGFNTHFVIIDELHAHINRHLVDVLTTSTGSRRQPLIWHITTADYDRESICNEKHTYAKKVRDGIIKDVSFLPVLYEASIDDDWTDPEVWRKANPNLDVSVSKEYLERECARAKETPSYENTFKRLHLNIKTEQDQRWLTMPAWDSCGDTVDATAFEGRPVWAGIDLGSTSDLTSLCLLSHTGSHYEALWWFWCPKVSAEKRERRDRVPYLAWARDGYLTMTPGNETDYDYVRRDVNAILEKHGCTKIAADRLFQGAQLCQQLVADGFDVIPFGMGFMSMAAPTAELERLINRAEFNHGNNPVMRWMASNASVELDAAGNMKPSKKKSHEKIDGIISAVMALGIAMVDTDTDLVYNHRGVIAI